MKKSLLVLGVITALGIAQLIEAGRHRSGNPRGRPTESRAVVDGPREPSAIPILERTAPASGSLPSNNALVDPPADSTNGLPIIPVPVQLVRSPAQLLEEAPNAQPAAVPAVVAALTILTSAATQSSAATSPKGEARSSRDFDIDRLEDKRTLEESSNASALTEKRSEGEEEFTEVDSAKRTPQLTAFKPWLSTWWDGGIRKEALELLASLQPNQTFGTNNTIDNSNFLANVVKRFIDNNDSEGMLKFLEQCKQHKDQGIPLSETARQAATQYLTQQCTLDKQGQALELATVAKTYRAATQETRKHLTQLRNARATITQFGSVNSEDSDGEEFTEEEALLTSLEKSVAPKHSHQAGPK